MKTIQITRAALLSALLCASASAQYSGPGGGGSAAVAVAGSPSSSCRFGDLAYQADGLSGQRIWACAGNGTVWTNSGTGNVSYVYYPYTWYVSQSIGNDSNDGKTQITPLKTIAAILAKAPFSAGDSIGLMAGDKWREELSLPATMAVGGWGSGPDRPLLDASDVIPSGNFTLASGQTFTYKATVTIADTSGAGFSRAWEGGGSLPLATSIANCDSILTGAYYVSVVDGTTITMYIHASDGSNPGSSGKIYETNTRYYGLIAGASSIVRNVWTRRNLANNGSMECGNNSVLTDIRASDGHKHNLLVAPGSTVNGAIIDEAYFGANAPNPLVYFGTFAGGENATFNDVSIKITPSNGGQAFYAHGGGGTPGAITFNRLTVQHLATGMETGYPFTVNYGYLSLTGGAGINGDASSSITLNNTTIIDPGSSGLISSAVSLTLRRCALYGGNGGVEISNPANVHVENTIFSTPIAIWLTGSGSSLYSHGNDFSKLSVAQYVYTLLSDIVLDSDGNNFGSGGQLVTVGSSTYRPWQFQATGFDATTVPLPVAVSAPFVHYNFVAQAVDGLPVGNGTPSPSYIGDISGRTSNVPFLGNGTNVPTYVGDGMSFNGSGPVGSTMGSDLLFRYVSGSISLSAVFKLASVSGTQALVSRDSGFTTPFGLQVHGNKLYAYVRDSSGTVQQIDQLGSHTLSTGVWYEAHVTYDGTHMRTYVNSALDYDLSVSNPMGLDGSARSFWLGRRENELGPNYLNGILADVKVWTIALSGSDVTTDYAATKAGIVAIHPGVILP